VHLLLYVQKRFLSRIPIEAVLKELAFLKVWELIIQEKLKAF
jgi:hypothetical protein